MTTALTPELLVLAALDLELAEPAGDERPGDWESMEGDWRRWLAGLFGRYVRAGFAPHHEDFWSWVWAIEPGARPSPFVAIWARGGAKSTSAELGVVAAGARQKRRYVLYVSSTQDRADDHVQNASGMLESPNIEAYYPEVADRMVGKYGHSRGWRRNRVRCANGFTIDAMGLDVAARGAKVDEDRPDMIVLDDIDDQHDSPETIRKKISIITRTILPAGAPHAAVLAVQNKIHADGVFARLADGRADFLTDRILSGPVPALEHMAWEQQDDGRCVLTAGEPTWQGQDLETCQNIVNTEGLTAFLAECQHEVDAPPGGMYDHIDFRHCGWDDLPDLVRVVVWVDPAVTNTDESDAHGIQADGIAGDGTIYRLFSWEDRTSPTDALQRAIRVGVRLHAEAVGVETDQGGDTWLPTYQQAARGLVEDEDEEVTLADVPRFRAAKAGAGHGSKAHRSAQMLADYEKGRFVHVVGTHDVLERGLRRFPRTKPFDLADAAYWSWYDLTVGVEEHEAVVELGNQFRPSRLSAWDNFG